MDETVCAKKIKRNKKKNYRKSKKTLPKRQSGLAEVGKVGVSEASSEVVGYEAAKDEWRIPEVTSSTEVEKPEAGRKDLEEFGAEVAVTKDVSAEAEAEQQLVLPVVAEVVASDEVELGDVAEAEVTTLEDAEAARERAGREALRRFIEEEGIEDVDEGAENAYIDEASNGVSSTEIFLGTTGTAAKTRKTKRKSRKEKRTRKVPRAKRRLSDADVAGQAEVEVNGEKRRHFKLFPGLWWALGVCVIALAVFGAVWVQRMVSEQLSDGEVRDEQGMASIDGEQDGNELSGGADAEEKPEEVESEEKPSEEVKEPEPTPVPEPQPQPQPAAGEIEPRPSTEVRPEVVPGSKVIALTFDDGPSSATTPRLLDILAAHDAKATFFVLGYMAERAPWILQREVAEGHEVASHTPYHNQLTKLSFTEVRNEALEMDRIFRQIIGKVPPFTRPPYGSVNETVKGALAQPLILWSVDPRDWADRNAAVVCQRVVDAARDGAIVLMHDIHSTTVDAVPCIVDTLRVQGYQFLTVSELAAVRDVPLVSGQVYYSF